MRLLPILLLGTLLGASPCHSFAPSVSLSIPTQTSSRSSPAKSSVLTLLRASGKVSAAQLAPNRRALQQRPSNNTNFAVIPEAESLEEAWNSESSLLTGSTGTRTQQEKWIMLGLLWSIACLSSLDRVAMSVALLPMSTEFDLSDTFKGGISSFFSVGYGLGILPAGLVISKWSPRLVMAVGLAGWSVATVATPWAADSLTTLPIYLLLARALVGAGESVLVPTLQRLLVSWTTVEEKATALGIVWSGFHAGSIAAYVLSPIIMEHDGAGWRGLFEVYGAMGLLILLPWLVLARDGPYQEEQVATSKQRPFPDINRLGTALNCKASWESALQTVRDAPWKEFAQSKAAWALLFAHCAKNWGLYNILAWTPTFYSQQYDIGVRDSAMLSVLPSITGAACVVVAGTAADAVLKWLDDTSDEARSMVRKSFQMLAFLGQGIVMAALAWHIPEHAYVAQVFLMAAIGLMAFNAAGFESGIQEKSGERWAGLLYSVTSLPAVMVGTAGVYVTGQILDHTNQDWSYVFGLNAAINVLGAVAFVALYNSKREFD